AQAASVPTDITSPKGKLAKTQCCVYPARVYRTLKRSAHTRIAGKDR
ncbi:unnamed protein product, partial [marine sediment metagenome]